MTSDDAHVIAVNGRFVTMPVTGSQRYARELVSRLALSCDSAVLLIAPGRRPDQVVLDGATGRSWGGPAGHAWEQAVLPRRAARLEADVLLSLCNSGPLRTTIPHVVGMLDASPYLRPGDFTELFVRWVRFAWPRLARRARRIVTLSAQTAGEITDVLDLPVDRVVVVPPGVGPPFTDTHENLARTETCLFVGGHDPRKNLAFLLDLWPEVHARLGLDLLVVRRGASRPHGADPMGLANGVRMVEDPGDRELADLYAGSLCVLSPSYYEGFGLPLLEGMASGTPFLSTDAGAARDLAVETEQILPLDPDAWMAGLRRMASGVADDLGEKGRDVARGHTWERSAAILADALGTACT